MTPPPPPPSSASASSAGHTNRLIHCTSPYLLQHAHNPVDWYPWGPEALDRARRENKPIFLSIGYSACHWCHVMEREVFENPEIAALMNKLFVNIKVDREERPDIDELYMLATQIATGSGGWPMSLWLTPEREPFYAGTYLPPVDSDGRPGFPRVCQGLAEAWQNRRDDMIAQAHRLVEAVEHFADESASAASTASPVLDLPAALQSALEQFADRFDPQYGGLGSAPKFPPSTALPLWLELLKSQKIGPPPSASGAVPVAPVVTLSPQSEALLRSMLTVTLDHMARGGMYDQIGGGFARYSTDEQWLIPHFEKMLYDNAQLAPAYALAAAFFARPDYARVARQTLDFFLREMSSPQGAFFTALDADSEGHEGRFYTWTISQIREVLPDPADAQLIMDHFGVTPEGNFTEPPGLASSGRPGREEGPNVLHIARPIEQLLATLPADRSLTPQALQKRLDALCLVLRRARDRRPHPSCDDKILTAYNALMISALAIAGRVQREPNYLEAAHRAMGFLLLHHMAHGRQLLRTTGTEKPEAGSQKPETHSVPAFLEDHAFLLNAMCDLIDATSPTSLPGTMARRRARELADTMIREFEDPAHGGFFLTSAAHDPLFARLKNATDGATPSPNAVAIRALLRLAQSSGREQYRDTALRAVAAFAPLIQQNPSRFPTILLALLEDAQFRAQTPYLGIATPVLETLPSAPAGSVTTTAPPMAARLQQDSPLGAPHCLFDPVTLPPLQRASSFVLPLTLHIAPGFHIQSQEPRDREVFATVARLRTDLPIVAQEWSYPEAHPLPGLAAASDLVWSDTITLTARITLAPHCPSGPNMLHIILLAQPCSLSSCLPPEKITLDIPIQIAP